MELKPYPEYKDSGVPWIPVLPSHWQTRKTKYLFGERVQKGYPNEPLLAATQTKGVIPKTLYENRTVTAQKDLHLLKLVKKGDFVISLRSFQGGIEYAYYQGIISPAYTVMIPSNDINPNYFKHLAKSKHFLSLLKICVTGIRQGQNIDYERLKREMLPLPPKEEQEQIACFLDYQMHQFSRFIRAKQRMIALLNEQKQVIINQAVTKGIDLSVKLKPSGVDYLGDIPEQWRKVKLCYFVNLLPGYAFPSSGFTHSNDDIRLLRGINISPGKMRWEQTVRWAAGECDSLIRYRLRPEDIVVGMDRPWVSKGMRVAVVEKEDTPSLLLQRVSRLRATSPLKQKYLQVLLSSNQFVEYFKPILTGISVPHISPKQILSFHFALPSENEQDSILSFVENKTKWISLSIAKIEQEISQIRAYQTRLIADVVTGKIDVRDVPVEPIADSEMEEPLPVEDTEELDVLEEISDAE